MTSDLNELAPEFLASLDAHSLSNHRLCGPSVLCATKQYNFIWAVVVNIDPIGHDHQHCYAHAAEAVAALEAWDGLEHPSGPWIKCKGADGELLSPEFGPEVIGNPIQGATNKD